MSSREHPGVLGILLTGGLVLFLLLLPFHLVIKQLIPDPVGTYWKEILLGLLVALWAIHGLLSRRLRMTGTPLDGAVLLYLGLLLVRFALDRTWWVGAWGLYVSVMYLPLFWVTAECLRIGSGQVLNRHLAWTKALTVLLVGIGAVLAIGGLVEFVLDVPLWPSVEMTQRQGFPGVFIYGTHVRRVYFTLDSPTTLANTLAMLLPLALAWVLLSRRTSLRVAFGLAAALMAACIVVTFSRGIWVAMVLSLVVMGVLSGSSSHLRRGFRRWNWKPLLVAGGTLMLIGLAWGWATLARSGEESPTYQGVVELSQAAYRTAPVTNISQGLLAAEPVHGQAVSQTWTLLDPITGQDDERLVLYQHPPESGKSEIIYRVVVPEAGALRFGIALSPDVWSPTKGDGASFQIYVAEPDAPQEGQFVLVRYINPKHNPSDRRWRNFLVDLSPWVGRTVHLSLITEGGPVGDWAFDWAGWAELQLVSVEPNYFSSAQTENAILRHTSSILDWARDETNRDRLAAWSLALNAWRTAPLWGTGLGTTGVAALRTDPEHAFVTESQWLKALVELGPLGVLALAYLWFQIMRVGYRTYRTAEDPSRQALVLGILISLLVVFIEGWVYQNLEVKQVNAYFWTLVGALAFLAAQVSVPEEEGQPSPGAAAARHEQEAPPAQGGLDRERA